MTLLHFRQSVNLLWTNTQVPSLARTKSASQNYHDTAQEKNKSVHKKNLLYNLYALFRSDCLKSAKSGLNLLQTEEILDLWIT